jgi:hypothetical protein
MLAQLQALRLIVRADAGAVELVRARDHLLIDQPADDLAVIEDERHLARAHLEHGARALPVSSAIGLFGGDDEIAYFSATQRMTRCDPKRTSTSRCWPMSIYEYGP